VPHSYNPEEPMPPQQLSWSCSACSLAWLNRALHIDYATDERSAIEYIGYPHQINPIYGLMDGSGGRLAECLREQGAPAATSWPTWLQTYQLAQVMPLLIGGVNWNHWVGVRGSGQGLLSLANSAPGWGGIYDEMWEQQWNDQGPFAVVVVPLLTAFPPPNPT
jgi:hypothetical protein